MCVPWHEQGRREQARPHAPQQKCHIFIVPHWLTYQSRTLILRQKLFAASAASRELSCFRLSKVASCWQYISGGQPIFLGLRSSAFRWQDASCCFPGANHLLGATAIPRGVPRGSVGVPWGFRGGSAGVPREFRWGFRGVPGGSASEIIPNVLHRSFDGHSLEVMKIAVFSQPKMIFVDTKPRCDFPPVCARCPHENPAVQPPFKILKGKRNGPWAFERQSPFQVLCNNFLEF